MTLRLATAILLSISLTACQSLWTRIDAKAVAYKADHYTVDLPSGWVRTEVGKIVYITRDGASIQRMTIEFKEHAKAFEKTEQPSKAGMLPSELADRYIAEIRAEDENGLPSLEILSNRPATVDGRLGFKLHLRYISDNGLRVERLVNGFATEDGFYAIAYEAPTLHFFDRDRGTFEGMIGSFRAI